MTLAHYAMPGEALLDGVPLPAASAWELGYLEGRALDPLAAGRVRELLTEPPPGHPEIVTVRTMTLAHGALNASQKALVRRLTARPGIYSLVLWRAEELTYLGDGARAAFELPNGWTLAVDSAPVPAGIDPDQFELAIRLGVTDDPLPLTVQDATAYAAAEPPEGEVWRLRDTHDFKLGSPPAYGSRIWAEAVPVYRVVRAADADRRRADRLVVEDVAIALREAPPDPEAAP